MSNAFFLDYSISVPDDNFTSGDGNMETPIPCVVQSLDISTNEDIGFYQVCISALIALRNR